MNKNAFKTFYKITAVILLCSLLFIPAIAYSSPAFGIYRTADGAEVTAIIFFDDGADTASIREGILSVLGGNREFKYTYSELFSGAAIRLNESDIGKLNSLAGVAYIAKAIEYYADTPDNETVDTIPGIKDVMEEERMHKNMTEYQGEGMIIAVIDGGFDIKNKHWVLSHDDTASLTADMIKESSKNLNAKGYKYYNAKVPFYYNYADKNTDMIPGSAHGTHVSGIIGANDVNTQSGMKGVAPEAQLLMMNVFDKKDKTDTAEICAAFEDAVTLGADVINFSAGSPAGYEDGYPFEDVLALVIKAADKKGVSVICAAGNSGNSYLDSYYTNKYSLRMPTADFIDNGTVAAPASIDTTTAAGSLSSEFISDFYITLNDEEKHKIPFTDTTLTEIPELKKSFTEFFDGRTIEYVPIPGAGKPEDFNDLKTNLNGKLALIKRGELTFADKILNAEAAGAAGVIVYNNVPDSAESLKMLMSGAKLPAIFISYTSGQLLIGSNKKSVSIHHGDIAIFNNPNMGIPLTSSSSGPTPNLFLKPDILAVGENIISTAANNTLIRMTGTSMAAGYISGITAILKQYARANGLNDSPGYIKSLMVNSAALASSNSSGIEYSPRVQGGGIVNIEKAMQTETLLAGRDGRSKIELGDNLKKTFNIDYSLANITDKDQIVYIRASLLSDGYLSFNLIDGIPVESGKDERDGTLPYFISAGSNALKNSAIYADNGYMNINRHYSSFDGKGSEVKIKAGETLNLSLKIQLDNDFINEYSKIFKNGFYIDGFITAETKDGGTVSSIPFMGFYGDWAKIPVIDALSYDETIGYYDLSYLFTTLSDHSVIGMWQIGKNLFNEEAAPYLKHAAFSPNADKNADIVYLALGLLRNCELEYACITGSDGRIIDEMKEPVKLIKTYTDSGMMNIFTANIWGGGDEINNMYTYPDGAYTLTIKVRSTYKNARTETLSIPFRIDTVKPKVVSHEIYDSNKGAVLRIKTKDNHCVQGATFYNRRKNIIENVPHVHKADEKCGEAVFEYNIQKYIDEGYNYVYCDILDYAFNEYTYRVSLNEYVSP